MKKMKKNNKGFTLVELIVVIAILGVLAAVLVPQYLQYVEKSRVSVDENAIGEIIHAGEISLADGTVYDDLPTTSFTISVTSGSVAISSAIKYTTDAAGTTTVTVPNPVAADDGSELMNAMSKVVRAPILKSNTYSSKTYTINVTYSTTTGYSFTPYTSTKWA